MKDAVDDILIQMDVLPESARASWEERNLERGDFLLPVPAEVEIYRALGEPLPLLWNAADLE